MTSIVVTDEVFAPIAGAPGFCRRAPFGVALEVDDAIAAALIAAGVAVDEADHVPNPWPPPPDDAERVET